MKRNKYLFERTFFCLGSFVLAGMGILNFSACKREQAPSYDPNAPVLAFCVDYNWSGHGYAGLALPDEYNTADAKSHVDWCKARNINTIQSFCVSHCGYAWYDSAYAPKIKGLKTDFLRDLVNMGHKEGMRVLGYFSPGTNVYWKDTHPDECYDNGNMFHVVYTKKYLEYLGNVIKEAVSSTGIDGFMIDSLFTTPCYSGELMKWLPCEQEMYVEIMNAPFPGVAEVTAAQTLEYKRRAVERCWDVIRTSAKSVNPQCIIMLTCHDLTHEQLRPDSKIYKETDWLMNENADPEFLKKVRNLVGPDTRLIQCISGWATHDAQSLFGTFSRENVNYYGFAWADEKNALPHTLEGAGNNVRFITNAKNIKAMKDFYGNQMHAYRQRILTEKTKENSKQ